MTTAVIVQARMGSSSLPGKVMQNLAGKPVLAHVLARCGRIAGADLVVCAVPDEDASRPLEQVALAAGARAFRGSERDVLRRYLDAARDAKADVVMRVTSDCPLIDPAVCAAVLALRARMSADYASNNMPRSFPHGLDCEAFTTRALAEAASKTEDAYDHEHVTPWLRRAPHLRRANLDSGRARLADQRWTLDYPEDLDFFRAVFDGLPNADAVGMNDVVALLSARPELNDLNAIRRTATA